MGQDILNQPEAKNEHLGYDSQSKVKHDWGLQGEEMIAEALAFM